MSLPASSSFGRRYYQAAPPPTWGDPAELDLLAGVPRNGHDPTAARRALVRATNAHRQHTEQAALLAACETPLERARVLAPILGDRGRVLARHGAAAERGVDSDG